MPRLTEEQDRQRVSALFEFDRRLGRGSLILGIDEVGRGPLAGPLAAGGVVFEAETYIKWLNDSKKITENRRPEVANNIISKALFSTVAMIEPKIIDEVGIAKALRFSFCEVIKRCEDAHITLGAILIDGNNIDLDDDRVHCIVKGDSKSASIAAASVIAKVERDNYMEELSQKYPEYEWSKNKGYGTKAHIDAINKFGITEHHRKSFLKKYM